MALSFMMDPVRSLGKGKVLLTCSATIGATGAVTALDGKKFSVASPLPADHGTLVRTGAGAYTLTLPGRGKVKVAFPSIALEGTAHVVTVDDIDEDAREIDFVVRNASLVAADPAEASRIHFFLVVENSSVR